MANANAAIYYHPDGFDTATRMMGRQAAGEALLRALARDEKFGPVIGAVDGPNNEHAMRRQFAALGGDAARLSIVMARDQAALAKIGCLMRPDPILAAEVWRRHRRPGNAAYSLCGLTHTVASKGPADGLGEFMLAPNERWDAIICTSLSVRRVMERMIDSYCDYLRERFGANMRPRFELPVIPLGVNCADFTPQAMAPHRARLRGQLGIGEQDFTALFLGRLSYHAKANPVPMMQALELCARASGQPVHFIMAGSFFSEGIGQAFRAAPAQFCPSVRCHFLDGRDADIRAHVWAAADVFLSLVDNIQETFGLAPLEAMAASLPVVVSDWDGYRETVRDGQDGFLIPTLMSAPGSAADLAASFADDSINYDRYIAAASNLVSVDASAAALALQRLAGDPSLRRQMGAAGRARALADFDWPVVLRAWQALWADLAQRRGAAAAAATDKAGKPHPLHFDPTLLFADYAHAYLDGSARLSLQPGWTQAAIDAAIASPMFSHSATLLLAPGDIAAIANAVAGQPGLSLQALGAMLPQISQRRCLRGAMLLSKVGALRVEDATLNATKPPPLGKA